MLYQGEAQGCFENICTCRFKLVKPKEAVGFSQGKTFKLVTIWDLKGDIMEKSWVKTNTENHEKVWEECREQVRSKGVDMEDYWEGGTAGFITESMVMDKIFQDGLRILALGTNWLHLFLELWFIALVSLGDDTTDRKRLCTGAGVVM